MWIARSIRQQLHRLAETRPAVLVTGARQTGKTSLIRHEFPEMRYVTLDLPTQQDLAQQDPEAFLKLHPPPVIIDEAQNAPKLFRYLKVLIDANRDASGRFILTGSQKHQLMKGSAESLAGRVGLLQLETLSREEVLATEGLAPTVDASVLEGGFPELSARAIDRLNFYESYVATYLERDVRSLLNVSSLSSFERFLRCCALRSGQLLNKAELARDVAIAASTANDWLSVLEASNLVVLLQPWFQNRTRSLVKSPKLYLADSGLLCYLMNVRSESEMISSPNWGAIWETFVFAELRKRQLRQWGEWSCYFWSDYAKEVDFLIHRGGDFDLYDAKTSAFPELSDAKQLRYVAGKLGEHRVRQQGVICRAANSYPLGNGINAIAIDSLLPPPHSAAS